MNRRQTVLVIVNHTRTSCFNVVGSHPFIPSMASQSLNDLILIPLQ